MNHKKYLRKGSPDHTARRAGPPPRALVCAALVLAGAMTLPPGSLHARDPARPDSDRPLRPCDDPVDVATLAAQKSGARALLVQGRYPEGFTALEDVERRATCATGPMEARDLAHLYYLEAYVLWRWGRDDDAMQRLQIAISIHPDLQWDASLGEAREQAGFVEMFRKAHLAQLRRLVPGKVLVNLVGSDGMLYINGWPYPVADAPVDLLPGRHLVQRRLDSQRWQGFWLEVRPDELEPVDRHSVPREPGTRPDVTLSMSGQRLSPVVTDRMTVVSSSALGVSLRVGLLQKERFTFFVDGAYHFAPLARARALENAPSVAQTAMNEERYHCLETGAGLAGRVWKRNGLELQVGLGARVVAVPEGMLEWEIVSEDAVPYVLDAPWLGAVVGPDIRLVRMWRRLELASGMWTLGVRGAFGGGGFVVRASDETEGNVETLLDWSSAMDARSDAMPGEMAVWGLEVFFGLGLEL